MINTIPGGIFEHADDWLLHANPGFFSNSFEAPSPTFGGGGISIHWGMQVYLEYIKIKNKAPHL